MEKIIGREEELSILESAFKSTKPEFIALFGRRRVGKTFLVRNLFSKRKNTIFFSVTGMKEGKTSQQIKNFVTNYRLFQLVGLKKICIQKNLFQEHAHWMTYLKKVSNRVIR